MIAIKDHSVLTSIMEAAWHPVMVKLANWCAHRYSQFFITCGYRDGDPGVHGTIPCRGIDIRSTVFTDPDKVVEDINFHWNYDPSRPTKKCAVYHDVGQGYHIHLQVSNQTAYNDNGPKIQEV